MRPRKPNPLHSEGWKPGLSALRTDRACSPFSFQCPENPGRWPGLVERAPSALRQHPTLRSFSGSTNRKPPRSFSLPFSLQREDAIPSQFIQRKIFRCHHLLECTPIGAQIDNAVDDHAPAAQNHRLMSHPFRTSCVPSDISDDYREARQKTIILLVSN